MRPLFEARPLGVGVQCPEEGDRAQADDQATARQGEIGAIRPVPAPGVAPPLIPPLIRDGLASGAKDDFVYTTPYT